MEMTFTLRGEYIELIKLLKTTGVCDTGGTAKIAVAHGLVRVDGQVELRKRRKIRNGQVVAFDTHRIAVIDGMGSTEQVE